MSNPGPASIQQTNTSALIGVRLTRSDFLYPSAAILANTSVVYQQDGVGDLWMSNGTALVPLKSGQVVVSNLISGSSAAATSNATAINLAASQGGQILITTPGVVYINSTCIGGATPTQFIIGANTIIRCVPRLAGGKAFPAFQNFNFNPTRFTVGAISAAYLGSPAGGPAGRFTIGLTGHTLIAGTWLYMNGDTTENWNGAWLIESVVAGVSVTILTGFANPVTGFVIPQPSAGTLGCAMDADFSVIGGTIDMNFIGGGFAANGNYLDHGVNINNHFRTRIDTRINGVGKYAVCSQNGIDCRVTLDGQGFADGVHFYGPQWNPQVLGLTGSWGDDGAVLQTVDGSAYLGFMLPENSRTFPGGHIYGGKLANINTTWNGNAAQIPLYCASGISASSGSGSGYTWAAGDLGFRFKGQQFIDVVGHSLTGTSNYYSSGSVAIGGGYVPTTGFIESLVIRGLRYSNLSLSNTGGGLITIGQLLVECPASDTYVGYPFSSNVDQMTIKSFTIKGGNFKNNNTNSPNVVTLTSATATINLLVYEQCIFAGGTGPTMYAFGLSANGSTLGSVTFNQCYGLEKTGLLDLNSFTLAAVPRIAINGGDYTHNSGLIAIGTAQAVDVSANDVKISSGSGQAALLNAYGSGKVRVYGRNVQFGGSAVPYLNISSGNTCEWYNSDGTVPVDITKLARTRGQTAMHNGGTTAGTIVANNLCISDSTQAANGWKQLSNTSLVY